MHLRRPGNGSGSGLLPIDAVAAGERRLLNEESFRKMISLERKRTERSRKPFLLMLLDIGEHLPCEKSEKILGTILSALSVATRETDVTGWYKNDSIVGVMFTEIGQDGQDSTISTILARASDILRNKLSFEQFNRVSISFHVFPEEWDNDVNCPRNPTLYPDLSERAKTRRLFSALKRMMDIVGGAGALAFFAPVFLVIAVAIKATSKGPVFFRQRRIGQYGESFVFLKFRTMYVDNDASVHEEYVKQLIAGKAHKNQGVYKLTGDSRITRVGAFLRKTSLDEAPQFINVLKGEMSLVGPRPPVAYEVESYDVWHHRRLLEAKPGITGLWQVNGRNRVAFDEMVRLDLRYAKAWSPWLDLEILLRTPKAVVEGAH